MWRQLCARGCACGRAVSLLRSTPQILSSTATRGFFGPPWAPSADVFRQLQRQMREMQHEIDRAFGSPSAWYPGSWFAEFSPFRVRDNAARTEAYRIQNPIVEEDGVKKLLLEFDVHRFKPDQVNVITNAKDNTLTIEAKHKDDTSKFEFCRKLTLPEGVVTSELTCRFTSDGILQIRAPYNPPPEPQPAKGDTEIKVKHE